MITNSQGSKLGIDNLHRLIMIGKNWPNDVFMGCERRKPLSFSEIIKVQDTLLEYNEKLIFDGGIFT